MKYTEGGRPEAQRQGPLEAVYLGSFRISLGLYLRLLVSLYLPAAPPPSNATLNRAPLSRSSAILSSDPVNRRETSGYTKEASTKSHSREPDRYLALVPAKILSGRWLVQRTGR